MGARFDGKLKSWNDKRGFGFIVTVQGGKRCVCAAWIVKGWPTCAVQSATIGKGGSGPKSGSGFAATSSQEPRHRGEPDHSAKHVPSKSLTATLLRAGRHEQFDRC